MIPQSFIQELLARVDIVDVVERLVPLKREGTNHVARCPFHNEKSPSFKVSQPKQIYKCFGCGVSGNAIGFLMAYNGLEFVEAVRLLAGQIGLPVPEEPWRGGRLGERPGSAGPEPDAIARLHEFLREATRYYREQLRGSAQAIDYLRRRGLNGETAARFGIGYAPAGWQNLAQVFDDYAAAELATAGLVVDGESGRRFDFFRNRIMFPILDQRGMIVGFGARVIDPQDQPKYLNSRESPLFDKGRELYNLFAARRAIREAGRVLVVEGYMDVVALAQHGIGYAVAALGTATTPQHVHKLMRQADDVVFAFDGDAAGRRAAWRALENSLGQLVDGKNLSFLFLPLGDDPDSFVRREGREAFESLYAGALPLSGFLVKELSARGDLSSGEGRARLVRDAGPLIAQMTGAPALARMIRRRIAELTGLPDADLDMLWSGVGARGAGATSAASGGVRAPAAASGVAGRTLGRPRRRAAPSLARNVLQCLLSNPSLADRVECPEAADGDPEWRVVLAVVAFVRGQPAAVRAAGVLQAFAGTEHEALLREIDADAPDWEEAAQVEEQLEGANRQVREQQRRAGAMKLAQAGSLAAMTPEMRDALRELLRRP